MFQILLQCFEVKFWQVDKRKICEFYHWKWSNILPILTLHFDFKHFLEFNNFHKQKFKIWMFKLKNVFTLKLSADIKLLQHKVLATFNHFLHLLIHTKNPKLTTKFQFFWTFVCLQKVELKGKILTFHFWHFKLRLQIQDRWFSCQYCKLQN